VDGLPNVRIDPIAEIPSDAELYVMAFGFTASLMQVNHIHSRLFYHTIMEKSNLLQQGNSNTRRSKSKGSLLQKAKLKLIPHAVCNAYDQYAGFINRKTMICANDDESTCLGDNGGPLCMMINNECLQIGVVSFGESCSMGNRPIVYSNIAPAYGWIEKSVCYLSDNPPSNCQTTITAKEPIGDRSKNNVQVGPWRLRFQNYSTSLTDKPTLAPIEATSIDVSTAPSNDPSSNSAVPSDGPVHSAVPSDLPSLAPRDLPQNLNSKKSYNSGIIKRSPGIMKGPPGIMRGPPRIIKRPPGIIKRPVEKQKRHVMSDVYKNNDKKKTNVGHANRDLQNTFFDLGDMPLGVFRLPKDPSMGEDTNNSFSQRSQFDGESESSFTTSNSFRNGSRQSTFVPSSSNQSFQSEIVPSNFFENQDAGTNPISFSSFDNTAVVGSQSSPTDSNSLETGVANTNPVLFTPKLGECQGDCDSDEDCAEGLYCFMRNGGVVSVPGCSGFDPSRTDYCVRKTPTSPVFEQPLPILYVFPENPPNFSDLPLQRCQGDCDRDSDCADGLICYERPRGDTSIPGCFGVSVTRTDFCVDLNWSQSSFASDLTSDPTTRPTSTPSQSTSSTPSQRETLDPTSLPSILPSLSPTHIPTETKTRSPTQQPSSEPTKAPTIPPTYPRTAQPTKAPTLFPTIPRTGRPSKAPTLPPTKPKTRPPTNSPTQISTKLGRTQMQQMKPRSIEPTNRPTPTPTRSRPRPLLEKYPSPHPSKIQTKARSESSVPVTFAIYFDPWPQEVSWKIEREDSQLVAFVPTGTYKSPQDHMYEELLLEPGDMYVLTITDAGGDGIAGIGTMYEVFLTDRPKVILLAGNGVFEGGRSDSFIVPTMAELPSNAPSASTVSKVSTIKTLNVYLVIVFDNWHQETAWVISDENDPSIVFAEKTYDTYRSGDSITEEIALPAGGTYTFTVKDFFNDGIKDGEYLLMSANGDVIFKGIGEFGSFRSHTFTLPEK